MQCKFYLKRATGGKKWKRERRRWKDSEFKCIKIVIEELSGRYYITKIKFREN